MANGKCIITLYGENGINCAQIYSNYIFAAGTNRRKIEFWDLTKEHEKCTFSLEGHRDTITGLVFI